MRTYTYIKKMYINYKFLIIQLSINYSKSLAPTTSNPNQFYKQQWIYTLKTRYIFVYIQILYIYTHVYIYMYAQK